VCLAIHSEGKKKMGRLRPRLLEVSKKTKKSRELYEDKGERRSNRKDMGRSVRKRKTLSFGRGVDRGSKSAFPEWSLGKAGVIDR